MTGAWGRLAWCLNRYLVPLRLPGEGWTAAADPLVHWPTYWTSKCSDEAVTRPTAFDLATYRQQSVMRFEASLRRRPRPCGPAGKGADVWRSRCLRRQSRSDSRCTRRAGLGDVDVPIESANHAARLAARLAPEVAQGAGGAVCGDSRAGSADDYAASIAACERRGGRHSVRPPGALRAGVPGDGQQLG